MDLIHGYIYNTQPQAPRPPKGFLSKHLRGFGIILSIVLHISIFGWIFYEGVLAPFTEMGFVDEAYDDVKWIEITKLSKPLKYPMELLPQPGSALPLDKLNKEEEEKIEKPKPRKKEKKEEVEEEKPEEQEETADADEDMDGDETESTEPEQPPSTPRFGLINARPIREIVGKVYTVYKTGGLDIENTVFSLTLSFEVRPDGSLDNVRILDSSGSDQIDTAALNIASAISASHALMPLAVLSSTTATLDLDSEQALLRIVGYTTTSVAASDLATTFSQQLAGLRLLMSLKNQDAATLLSHLEVSNQGNQLSARLKMSRAEASALMRKNFGNLTPSSSAKQPETTKMNLMYGF
jgi:hypothetical protein